MLRKLVDDPKATWTCDEQRDAVLAACAHQVDVLAIIKTGAGKTMIPLIAAMLDKNKTTVIVLPLKSLMDDYKFKLDRMKVPFEQFTGAPRLRGVANIILVSVDMFQFPTWRQAAGELHIRKPIHRSCLDECHFAFTDNNFRQSALGNLYELRMFECTQLIVMSATVAEASVPHLIDLFELTDNVATFRTPTTRPEIRYVLEKPRSKSEIMSRTFDLVRSHTATFGPNDRGLIFVTYLEDGEALKTLLKVDFYAGRGGNQLKPAERKVYDVEKQEMVTRWRSGEYLWMISTAAFGAGNDYPHVRAVIHAGSPREMMGYTQEKSRSGRDKMPAVSYVLPRKLGATTTRPVLPQGAIDHKGILIMFDWLYGRLNSICSRYVITSFIDAVGTKCKDDVNAQPCSICRPSPSSSKMPVAPPPPNAVASSSRKRDATTDGRFGDSYMQVKKRRQQVDQQDQAYVDAMRAALTFFDGKCALCTVIEVEPQDKHSLFRCPSLTVWLSSSVNRYISWRDQIRYNPDYHSSICYICHVPQKNERLHRPFASKPGDACDFPDVVAMTAYGIYHHYPLGLASEHFGVTWNNLESYTDWLKGRPVPGHESNITAILLWYHQHILSKLSDTSDAV